EVGVDDGFFKADLSGAAGVDSSSSSTPTKSETKPKQETPISNANKPLNKTQLFINSIKESVSVSDMKELYPKAKSIKMQKRKVGPNRKVIQFAFVSFDNEADCTAALNAHTQIGGEKVNVSYAFAPVGKQQTKTNDESNKKQEKNEKKQEQKSTNGNNKQEKNEKKQEQKSTNGNN
ncbi:unnamed protein product, partial [Rotaria sordida]